MRTVEEFENFLERFAVWAASQSSIEAAALVGSWARGGARPDSDVDLVVVAAAPDQYLRDQSWVSHFGEPVRVAVEDWGRVQSLRVHYRAGPEIEFGWTTDAWIATDPIDVGTTDVIRNGLQVLLDRHGRLTALTALIQARVEREARPSGR